MIPRSEARFTEAAAVVVVATVVVVVVIEVIIYIPSSNSVIYDNYVCYVCIIDT